SPTSTAPKRSRPGSSTTTTLDHTPPAAADPRSAGCHQPHDRVQLGELRRPRGAGPLPNNVSPVLVLGTSELMGWPAVGSGAACSRSEERRGGKEGRARRTRAASN